MAKVKATSKADMDPNFEKRLREMKDWAKLAADRRRTGDQVKWYRPRGWSGGTLDSESMGAPFQRTRANNDAVNAMKDHQAPGTTGDIVLTTTMLETLAVMERAFRQRNTLRRPRATAHAAGRHMGQGNDRGPFIRNYVEYIRQVLKQTKG
jgi:hypothetical protein